MKGMKAMKRCFMCFMCFMFFMVAGFLAPSPAFAQNPVPDTTYGPGGSKSTATEKLKDGTTVETVQIRDKEGKLREQTRTPVAANREETGEREG